MAFLSTSGTLGRKAYIALALRTVLAAALLWVLIDRFLWNTLWDRCSCGHIERGPDAPGWVFALLGCLQWLWFPYAVLLCLMPATIRRLRESGCTYIPLWIAASLTGLFFLMITLEATEVWEWQTALLKLLSGPEGNVHKSGEIMRMLTMLAILPCHLIVFCQSLSLPREKSPRSAQEKTGKLHG